VQRSPCLRRLLPRLPSALSGQGRLRAASAATRAFNHAGNATAASVAAASAYFFGPVVVFWLMAVMAVNAGYGAAFWTLAAIAMAGLVLFLVAMPETAARRAAAKPVAVT
jgi:hypothetical protein